MVRKEINKRRGMKRDIKKTIKDYKEKVINCDIKIKELEEMKKKVTTEHKKLVAISLIHEEERVKQISKKTSPRRRSYKTHLRGLLQRQAPSPGSSPLAAEWWPLLAEGRPRPPLAGYSPLAECPSLAGHAPSPGSSSLAGRVEQGARRG